MIVDFNMMKTHYNCVSLFFNKMKRIISASNVDAETIRDAINECNDVLWLSWVTSEDALIAAMTLKLELEIIDDRLLKYVIKKTMIYWINETDQNFINRKKHKSITILHVLNARKFSSDLHCSQNFYLESEIKKSDSNMIDAKIRAETEMMHNRFSNLWALSEKSNQNSRSIQYNKIWTIVTRQFHKWLSSRIEFLHDWWKNS